MRVVKLTFLAAAFSLSAMNGAIAQSKNDQAKAQPKAKVGLDVCARNAMGKNPGEMLQAVLKKEKSGLVWEMEVQQDGKLMDIECSAETGKIVERETRVESASAKEFASVAKVSEEKAREVALKKYPGKVERVEYEIEKDGKVSYEFDIAMDKTDMRVEVDGETGEIVEASEEIFEVGRLEMGK